MDPTSDRTARDVRLAVGGPPPEDWDELTTPMLKLRWASALGYARRALAAPPTTDAATAILALAETLDRRGALLPELGRGSRAQRLRAAGRRLHITGTIAHAVGLPAQLRDAARAEAATTVAAVRDDQLTLEELRANGAEVWQVHELHAFLDAAPVRAGSSSGDADVAAGADPPPETSGAAEVSTPVVDISLPHPTSSRDRLRRRLRIDPASS